MRENDREVIDLARGIACLLLAELPDRLRHSRGVAATAARLAVVVPPADRGLLVAAGWLHDIGYSPQIRDTGFHPLDGARYLQQRGLAHPLVCLVAHHSGAAYTARAYHLDGQFTEFERPDGPVLDALAYADMTTGPQGQPMSFDERLAEALRRHGPGSVHARVMPHRHAYLAAAVERTCQRLAHVGTGPEHETALTTPSGPAGSTLPPRRCIMPLSAARHPPPEGHHMAASR